MKKTDYIALATVSIFSFFIILKWKEKKKDRFEEEILNLKNAVEFTIVKLSE